MVLAADGGTTVAIVIAVFTLLGTISANLVAYHKVRVEAKNTSVAQEHQNKQSYTEMAQNVLVQTIDKLNERLQDEAEVFEKKISDLKKQHEYAMGQLNDRHAEDIRKLEEKIETLTKGYERCRKHNSELTAKLEELEKSKEKGDAES